MIVNNVRQVQALTITYLEHRTDDDWGEIAPRIAKMILRNQIHSGSTYNGYVVNFSTFVQNVGEMEFGYECSLINGEKCIRFRFYEED